MRHLSAALLSLAGAAAASRRVVSDALQSLDSSAPLAWTVTNGTVTVPARVPGDLISDLAAGGVVAADPLFETNFRGDAWDACNWTYSATFALAPAVAAAAQVLLVLDGVKMVSDVALNGVALGYTADQFLRYEFDATAAVHRAGPNTLTVSFPTGADARNAEQRWMSCSG